MLGLRWRVLPRLRTGDWRSKLILVAQVAVALGALTAGFGMMTRAPLLLVGFTAVQALMVMGVVLFVVVALFAQRTLVEEEYDAGEVIFREGDLGQHVYVVKSGTVEVCVKRPDGSQDVVQRLGPGDHFGEMALLRKAPRTATIRTVTRAQVYRMGPNNFAALYTNLPGFRDHFNQVMDTRLQDLDSRK